MALNQNAPEMRRGKSSEEILRELVAFRLELKQSALESRRLQNRPGGLVQALLRPFRPSARTLLLWLLEDVGDKQ